MLGIASLKKVTTKMEDNSKYTAIKRKKSSFPLNVLLRNKKIVGNVLDYGCGHGADVEFLKNKEFNATGYDPNFFPSFPSEKYDTIICFYVLNVLPLDEENMIIANVSSLLKPNGKVYFAVRRDILKEGERFHVKHKKYTFQRKVFLDQKSVFKNKNCEIYEFEHFSVKNKGEFSLNPFLSGNDFRVPFSESTYFFAFHSKYPKSDYHIILTYKNQCKNTLSFTKEISQDLKFFTSFCIDLMKKEFKLDTIELNESTESHRLIKTNQWHLHLMGENE